MSNKTFTINITGDRELMKKIRGTEPLRKSQIHKDKREKRQGKWWNDPRNWD